MHIIQRGNNRQACFLTYSDYLVYLSMLRLCSKQADCAIHAYVLMTNHVHLLISPGNTCSPAALMKALGQRYVQYFNRRHQRTGTLWEGRFRSCLIEDERYLFTCQRYIELNPVRAGMVEHPQNYVWSSYGVNAEGAESDLVTPHTLYLSLGQEEANRQQAYRELFDDVLPVQSVESLRRATNGNYAFASDAFIDEVAEILGRPARPRTAGRPSTRCSVCRKR
ncbi:MAG: transposase [Telluria sp.]